MSDDEYEIPLQDQRVFGAGIKRKRVHFVPASSTTATAPVASTSHPSAQSVADRYLSLVLPLEASPETPMAAEAGAKPSPEATSPALCEICNLPLEDLPNPVASDSTPSSTFPSPSRPRPHASSLAHQVCLPHSQPPSHLDRSRKGLGILAAYGWDPDARRGLGARGQGIPFPIKARPKDDTLGLGVVLPPGLEAELKSRRIKVERLDAGKVRKLEEGDRRKRERLQDLFYRSDDLERYLGRG
ncbi:MAG: hypothetical protein M1818_001239 [Claussenomyces sp. TS43310]|nr:MAG: hypothetical protein M1818_001239 [Claussenomyces sp. TS43310]